MTKQNIKCLIWDDGTCERLNNPDFNGWLVDSLRAGGRYFLEEDIADIHMGQLTEKNKVMLSGWIYEQNERGVQAKITTKNFNDLLRGPMPSVPKRMELLAISMARFSPLDYYRQFAGDTWYHQEMLAACYIDPHREDSEMRYILELLVGAGYAERRGTNGYEIGLTGAGHVWVDKIKNPNIMSESAFVAMWFGGEMTAIYEKAIKLGVEDAGFKAVRIDKEKHANKIDDEIIARIRRSRFVVADFTSGVVKDTIIARGGVYYEAGFAHGLNIPVIFTCRKNCIDYLHFDTRQYNHIEWEDNNLAGFRKELSDRISAVVGDGPYRGSSDDS